MLPTAATFCVWFEAVRRAAAGPEDLVERVLGGAPNSVVAGRDGSTRPLAEAVGGWALAGARGTLALPVPGHPVGLAGPASFNQAALDAGEAVVLSGTGLGLVPSVDARTLVWTERSAESPAPADPDGAGRELRAVLVQSTRRLVELDVASWQPEIPDLLMNLRHRPTPPLPAGWEPRRVETLERALLCLEVVALALDGEGGAVTAYEMERRRSALRDLDTAARRALVAACSDSLDTP